MKAFLVNRVGDLGFALGIFLTFITFGSVEFAAIFERVASAEGLVIPVLGYEVSTITAICLLLFIGCMGKSAQLGLHTWLPDAMEGPTPVSALIHAATMVTAGVFFTARLSPLFEYSETALAVVAIVGAVTCIFAATVALVQNDIKRVIAYSTCSQLGYMFFAAGCSAYAAGIFHLMTHGFFKALLFLGAGSVIHAMSDEQDIRKMGGIWKKIPFTYAMMWIGSLALAGIPPFAGFYSKDIILEAAFASHNPVGQFAFWLGIVAAMLTAFYSWRLLILAFHGKTRASAEVISHVHESPLSMTIPLFLLAVGAVFSGYVGVHCLDMVSGSGEFWRGSIFVLERNNSLEHAHHVGLIIKLLPLIVGVLGISLAYFLYQFRVDIPAKLSASFKKVYSFLYNKWYFDEIYDLLFVKSARSIGEKFWQIFDVKLIDGMPNGAAYLSERGAMFLSRMQTGYLYHYALIILIGMAVLLTWSLMGI
jgi:NADH-quinone oxidoreductase subunit L